ncbi:MAG: tetratricopeptide repeat protein [Calditerrivibrio sp.]|nr:tetratricopeptide repeat protein [Calditerrivibrio sp.]
MDEASIKRYQKDVEYFSKKIEEDPSSRLFMPLAFAYLKLGKYDEVIDVCSKGLDKHPDYYAAKVLLANAFLEKGMKDEAKHLLFDVVEHVPDNYRANKMLGDILRESGDILGATIYYRTALVTTPEDFELRVLLDELTESLGGKEFRASDEIKNIDEAVAHLDHTPVDHDMASLKDELEHLNLDTSVIEEGKVNVVEIPVEGEGGLNEKLLEVEDKDLKIETNVFDGANVSQGLEDSMQKQEPTSGVVEESNLLKFDNLSDFVINESRVDKEEPATPLMDEVKDVSFDDLFGKEIDFDELSGSEKKSVLEDIKLDEPTQTVEMYDLDIDIDIDKDKDKDKEVEISIIKETGLAMDLVSAGFEKEEAQLKIDSTKDEHNRIVQELERWLGNIKKIKEMRNV